MKKFKVTQDLDYISGHLRYGHFEGIIEAESAREAQEMVEDDPIGYLSLVIDDYEVDAWDEGNNPIKMEEIE